MQGLCASLILNILRQRTTGAAAGEAGKDGEDVSATLIPAGLPRLIVTVLDSQGPSRRPYLVQWCPRLEAASRWPGGARVMQTCFSCNPILLFGVDHGPSTPEVV